MATIGIFDSGVGGLSVFREIRKILPAENYIYYSDSANGKKAILITGATAYFTVKGDYEIA